ncbi:hypothetical protein L3X38_025637 [Prunus dulcis]|uniref:O-fucosyltransferase family protein n=1 Tax=Prunus dulcis TaxID=3755 RepID=A0AAD4W233_PRUDU|nr:hypothetical protein L3X38_025637 [Prunus dulcis]
MSLARARAADVKTYLLTAISGGLNQQRRGITDALVAAYILNATLLVLKLGQKLFWKDSSNFDEIFDVDWRVAFNLGYLPGGDKTIIRVRNNTEEGIGSCKKYRGAWRQTTLTRYEVNINHSQGKVLPSVRVSDPGLLLKPDKPNLIIMAKPAGGPSKRDKHAGMDED